MSLNHTEKIAELERKLIFVMQTLRMKAMITTGLVGPDGNPTGRVFDGNLLELYHLQNDIPTVRQDEAEPPKLSNES